MSSENKEIFVRLFDNPDTINFADKPLRLGGKLTTISTQEFAKRSNFLEWFEGVVCQADMPKYSARQSLTESQLRQLSNDINSSMRNLAICYMNEKVGCGVFALEDIPKNTTIGMYAGSMLPLDESLFNGYALRLPKSPGFNGAINAAEIRNIAAFFQHLPMAEKNDDPRSIALADYHFASSVDKDDIATENLDLFVADYKGYPVVLFKTARDIKRGEQLGWNYGRGYWLAADEAPLLYDKMGNMLDTKLYRGKSISVRVCRGDQIYDARCNLDDNFELFPLILPLPTEDIVIAPETLGAVLSEKSHSPCITVQLTPKNVVEKQKKPSNQTFFSSNRLNEQVGRVIKDERPSASNSWCQLT